MRTERHLVLKGNTGSQLVTKACRRKCSKINNSNIFKAIVI